MKEIYERFDEAIARVEKIYFLAAMIADTSMPHDLRDFFEDERAELFDECFGIRMPDYVLEAIGDQDWCEVNEWLYTKNKLGYLIQFATPVMRPYAEVEGEVIGCSYSWGSYHTKWVYGDTMEEAMDKGFAWVAEQRGKEKCK